MKRGAIIEGDRRLLLTDPDGNRIHVEQAPAEAMKPPAPQPVAQLPRGRPQPLLAQPGNVTPAPHREEVAEQRLGEPPLKKMPGGDPARDAAGHGLLFESICVPGITDLQEGMNGVAIVDLNRDGLAGIVAAYSTPRGTGGRGESGEKLRVFISARALKRAKSRPASYSPCALSMPTKAARAAARSKPTSDSARMAR